MTPGAAPWSRRSRTLATVAQLAAAGAVAVGWYLAVGETDSGEQTPWLAVAVAGLALSGLVNGCWLTAGRGAVRRARAGLIAATRGAPAPTVPVAPERARVGLVGSALVHRPTCGLVRGKAVVGVDELGIDGRPCGVCRP